LLVDLLVDAETFEEGSIHASSSSRRLGSIGAQLV
jgi:hypothetical protein